MALKHTLIPLADDKGWNAALDGLPCTFAHTHAYNAAMAGGYPTFLYISEGEDFQVVCPFNVRPFHQHFDLVSPYGFSGFAWRGRHAGFAGEFKAFMAGQGYVAGYIVQHLLADAAPCADADDVFQGKQCFLMDLRQTEETLLSDMASDHRSRLRQWWKQQLALVTDKAELAAAFYTLYPEAMKRSGAKESYFFPEAALRQLVESPYALLMGAKGKTGIEAVSLFLYQGNYAEYYLNACTEEGRSHARGLVWHAMGWLKKQGVTTLNLGCGISEGDELEKFKQRFGGEARRFTILKQVYRPGEYLALCRARGVDERDRSGFFPSYRAPAFDKSTKEA